VPECIHGLELALCDICSPKAMPERPKPVRAAAGRSARVAGAVSQSRRSLVVGPQRVYHVTHVSNLERIIEAGAIDTAIDATPALDVSTDLTRELRLTAEIAPGESVAARVPFYLSPESDLWADLRAGAADETRWSVAARAAASSDFVVLVSTIAALDDVVVADGDAAATLTRFAAGDERGVMLERLHDTEGAARAEVLARGPVQFEVVQLIGVANDPMRDRVRELTDTKVAVYPPWFQQS
jgi:hypothetical protein